MSLNSLSDFTEGSPVFTHVSDEGKYASIRSMQEGDEYVYLYDIGQSRVVCRTEMNNKRFKIRSLDTGYSLMHNDESRSEVTIANGDTKTINTYNISTYKQLDKSILGSRYILTPGDEISEYHLRDTQTNERMSFKIAPKIYNSIESVQFSSGSIKSGLFAFTIGDKRVIINDKKSASIHSNILDKSEGMIKSIFTEGKRVYFCEDSYMHTGIKCINTIRGKTKSIFSTETKNNKMSFRDIHTYEGKLVACYKSRGSDGFIYIDVEERKRKNINIPQEPVECTLYKNKVFLGCFGDYIIYDLDSQDITHNFDKADMSKRNRILSVTKNDRVEFYRI